MISPAEYFVAWLSGFSAGVAGRPTEEQWQLILHTLKGATVHVLPPAAPPPPTPYKQATNQLSREQAEAIFRAARL